MVKLLFCLRDTVSVKPKILLGFASELNLLLILKGLIHWSCGKKLFFLIFTKYYYGLICPNGMNKEISQKYFFRFNFSKYIQAVTIFFLRKQRAMIDTFAFVHNILIQYIVTVDFLWQMGQKLLLSLPVVPFRFH